MGKIELVSDLKIYYNCHRFLIRKLAVDCDTLSVKIAYTFPVSLEFQYAMQIHKTRLSLNCKKKLFGINFCVGIRDHCKPHVIGLGISINNYFYKYDYYN